MLPAFKWSHDDKFFARMTKVCYSLISFLKRQARDMWYLIDVPKLKDVGNHYSQVISNFQSRDTRECRITKMTNKSDTARYNYNYCPGNLFRKVIK